MHYTANSLSSSKHRTHAALYRTLMQLSKSYKNNKISILIYFTFTVMVSFHKTIVIIGFWVWNNIKLLHYGPFFNSFHAT